MTEEHKQLFRQQHEGYAILYGLETERLRKMTFEDRVAEFNRIMSLAPPPPRSRARIEEEEASAKRWAMIYDRYEASKR